MTLLLLLLLLLNERSRRLEWLRCLVLSPHISRGWSRRQRCRGQNLRWWLIVLLLEALLLRLGVLKRLVRVTSLKGSIPWRLDHLHAGLRVLLLQYVRQNQVGHNYHYKNIPAYLNLVQFNVLLRPSLSKLGERWGHVGHMSGWCNRLLLLQTVDVVVEVGLVHHPLLGLLAALGEQLSALTAGLVQRAHHLRTQVRRHGLQLVLALQRVNVLDLSAGIHDQLQRGL